MENSPHHQKPKLTKIIKGIQQHCHSGLSGIPSSWKPSSFKKSYQNKNYEIERLTPQTIPWYTKRLLQEHTSRYDFATKYTKNQTIIDIACGNGFGTQILLQQGAKQIIAIDNDPQAITYAKHHYSHPNITFLTANAENLYNVIASPPSSAVALAKEEAIPSKSNQNHIHQQKIDVITSFETIEHLHHPQKFIQEIQKTLKTQGTLILSTPNKQYSHGDNPFHIKEFNLAELKTILSDFPQITWYGQRPVNRKIFLLYKFLETKLPFAQKFFRFRPWEPITIKKLKSPDDTNYLYFIAVCKKTFI